jgi:hypothetical protein
MSLRKRFKLAALLLAALTWPAVAPAHQGDENPAPDKAGRVLELIRRTQWPVGDSDRAGGPIVLLVMGDCQTAKQIIDVLEGQVARDRSIVVRPFNPGPAAATPDQASAALKKALSAAHAVYLCAGQQNRLPNLLPLLAEAGVLTISDIPGFIDQGGMACITVRDEKVFLDVDETKLAAARLKLAPPAVDSVPADRGSSIKAGMVLNFIRYADWPDTPDGAPAQPIVLTLVGESPIAVHIRQAMQEQRVRGRPIDVRMLKYPAKAAPDSQESQAFKAQARRAQVVFICDSERDRVESILNDLAGADVLTVSDVGAFAERGGMLGLTIRKERVVFDANPLAIQGTQLKVSSQLLRLARTVKTRGQS